MSEEPSQREADDLEMSLVIPCLNEAETLQGCVVQALETFRQHRIRGEVVVADNGSTDGSIEIASQAGARVVHVEQHGYGAALIGGILAARGQYILMGDADGSYDFREVPRFLAKLREGFDLVMGNRFKGGIRPGAMPWKNRYLGNPVLSGIGRLFFGSPASDFHCGLRAFSKAAFATMDMHTTGMEFASEMVIKASLLKLRVGEIPIVLSPDGRSRRPHLRPWRDGWRHLRFMLLYSPRWLFLYPGILLMVLGLALGAWVLPHSRTIGGVGIDVHTLFLAMIFALTGFQAVCFGLTTKIYAVTHGLHPPHAALQKAFQYLTLEVGLLIGGISLLAGSGGLIYSACHWVRHGLGPLNPTEMLRIVIPSAFLFLVGWQIVLTSFLLSILGIKQK
jgi:glycosyltransferase involved in cell wall biosynthesis